MNKSAIQKFAIWARTTLMEQVAQRAYQYGITQDGYGEENAITVNGMALSPQEQSQRRELVREIQAKGYDQVVEEVAYTWFNRFIALRYMEVNNYLPSHIRVFSNAQGAFDPEILKEALHIDLPGLDQSKVAEYIEKTDNEALYRYLLLTQCNALNEGLPRMFEKMGGYTELLFPNNMLRPDSVLGRMVADIPEEDWTDQVQIIGWLYQYYNTELKAETFELLKKNVKVTKERIPSATQLFTPDWIVRYMVENSLGRLWLDHLQAETEILHPIGSPKHDPQNINSYHHAEKKIESLRKNWRYYVDEAPQEQDVAWELAVQRPSVEDLRLEDIKIIDPCMGSGHILVYAFDVLMQLYESAGWSQRDAAVSIIQNNLYGLDIDDRAFQLAYFAVMMKARQYNRRIFSKPVRHHLYSIQESNEVNHAHLAYLGADLSELEKNDAKNQMLGLLDALQDAKTFGSLLCVKALNWKLLHRFAAGTEDVGQMSFEAVGTEQTCVQLQTLLEIAEVLARQYDVVVTNPPYMAVSNGDATLNKYIKDNYPDSKGDLFAAFIERCGRFARQNGYQAMITQHAWMFLSSFEKLRTKLLQSVDIVNMAHLGARAFEEIGGEVVQTTSFVLRRAYTRGYTGTYCRLAEPTTQQGKEDMFLAKENRYAANQNDFSSILGQPVAYWASKRALSNFDIAAPLLEFSRPRVGQNTGDNDRFLRFWQEVLIQKIGFCVSHDTLATTTFKWIPYNKGGSFRRWYGNFDRVVNWENDGKEIKEYAVFRNHGKHWSRYIQNIENMCRKGVSWSDIASTRFACRYLPDGFICDVKGSSTYPDEKYRTYIMAFLNSHVAIFYLQMLNPTTTFQVGNIGGLPFIYKHKNSVDTIAEKNIELSKADWNSYETSWDFKRHPLV